MSDATTSLQSERRLARTAPAAVDFLRAGGWSVVSTKSGDRGGLTAHRGVLHPDEWVDPCRLAAMVEQRFGFGIAELRPLYCQGRKSAAQRALRARVDARLLEIARTGGNLTLLADALGVHRETVARALTRARAAERDDFTPQPPAHAP